MEKISENQNIHNMMKYNQPVGRLRDRAPSLLAGRFELERRRYNVPIEKLYYYWPNVRNCITVASSMHFGGFFF